MPHEFDYVEAPTEGKVDKWGFTIKPTICDNEVITICLKNTPCGIDKKQATVIIEKFGKNRRGFGSIPVIVKLGKTEWKTSIFPDSKSGTFLLPLKAQVRKKEEVEEKSNSINEK